MRAGAQACASTDTCCAHPDGTAGAILCDKEAALSRILSTLTFNQARARAALTQMPMLVVRSPHCVTQALVFCNLRGWAEALAERLTRRGFPAAFTCGARGSDATK